MWTSGCWFAGWIYRIASPSALLSNPIQTELLCGLRCFLLHILLHLVIEDSYSSPCIMIRIQLPTPWGPSSSIAKQLRTPPCSPVHDETFSLRTFLPTQSSSRRPSAFTSVAFFSASFGGHLALKTELSSSSVRPRVSTPKMNQTAASKACQLFLSSWQGTTVIRTYHILSWAPRKLSNTSIQ